MKMETYQISEAEKLTGEKAHVLRYWEEELGLSIGRNTMGHRVYTAQDIQIFLSIKELKKKGLHLKAIRELLPKLRQAAAQNDREDEIPEIIVPAVLVQEAQNAAETGVHEEKTSQDMGEDTEIEVLPASHVRGENNERKFTGKREFPEVILEVVPEKSDKEAERGTQTDNASSSDGTRYKHFKDRRKETDRKKEEKEKKEQFYRILERLIRQMMLKQRQEERYKRVDEAIRRHQQSRREAAATTEQPAGKKKKNRQRR